MQPVRGQPHSGVALRVALRVALCLVPLGAGVAHKGIGHRVVVGNVVTPRVHPDVAAGGKGAGGRRILESAECSMGGGRLGSGGHRVCIQMLLPDGGRKRAPCQFYVCTWWGKVQYGMRVACGSAREAASGREQVALSLAGSSRHGSQGSSRSPGVIATVVSILSERIPITVDYTAAAAAHQESRETQAPQLGARVPTHEMSIADGPRSSN